MSGAVDQSPTIDQTLEALEELTDILVAAQELGEKFRNIGRPFFAYCARELEDDGHNMFHQLELLGSGWKPESHAEC
jgi:hypothetical protein